MPNDSKNYLRLKILREEFRREALELLAIAERAGDTRAEAIEWTMVDTQIGKMFDQIAALEGQ